MTDSNLRETENVLCECGHPLDAHELVPGVVFDPPPRDDEPCFRNPDGTPQMGLPDVWICTGTRLADTNAADFSPWDLVCGCVLHEDPSPKPGLRKVA